MPRRVCFPGDQQHVYGTWQQPERQESRGRYPEPRRVPRPDLLYAQVVKRREGAQRAPRVGEVTQEGVFATPSALEERLANSATSSRVNTSFVERNHLALRQLNWRSSHVRNNSFKVVFSTVARRHACCETEAVLTSPMCSNNV